MAAVNRPMVGLSQPSYAPARVMPAATGAQSQVPSMFRHALLRVRLTILISYINHLFQLQTVADRTGVPASAIGAGGGGIQLMQPTIGGPLAANQK
jgi:hypothetical protein